MHEAKGVVASLECFSDQMLKLKENVSREREKGTVQQIMWIIIPGQQPDERETLTHHALMQPGTPVQTNGGEREKQGWTAGSLDGESKTTLYSNCIRNDAQIDPARTSKKLLCSCNISVEYMQNLCWESLCALTDCAMLTACFTAIYFCYSD